MEFKEPKVEIIKLNTNDVVFASPNGGQSGTESCIGTGSTNISSCADGYA